MNYKVVFNPAVDLCLLSAFEKEFETHAEAEAALNAIADYTLLLHECSLMTDHSNFGLVMRKNEDGDWIEVDGDDEELF